MLRRFLGAAILLFIVSLLVYTVLLNTAAGGRDQASPKELTVVTKTKGHEELEATLLDGQVRISLKNNHTQTITAFAIRVSGTATIREDFAYSEVRSGIEPGQTFETSYSVSPSSEVPTIHLLAVLLKDGTDDGDSKVARQISDQRLGQKIQILRTLRILEREGQSRKDFETTKSDIVAALNTTESETLTNVRELSPLSRSDNPLSDELKAGLQWGREKILRRFDELEKLPPENRERGVTQLTDQTRKLFSKL